MFSSRDWEIAFKQPINFEATGQFGDYFGGVIGTLISLAALIFLFINLIEQRASFKKERFETRYFEMIKFHKENVSDLVFTTKDRNQKGKEELIIRNEGKKVFKVIDFDFIELFKELSPLFKKYEEEEIYVVSYLKDLKENSQLKERKINFKNYAKIDIVFSILLTGLSSQDRDTLSKVFDGRYKPNLYETAIALAALKPKKESFFWRDWKSKSKEFLDHLTKESIDEVNIYSEEDFEAFTAKIYRKLFDSIYQSTIKFDKYYGGHQFRLGHYFRNIFQTLNYINDNSDLSHEEKQENINLLKAQLSTFEQKLIFYYSVSFYGRKWELEMPKEPSKETEPSKRLITLYDFLENIPNDVIFKDEIIVSHYYPEMNLENKAEIEENISGSKIA
ncbi:putative phage abortive infection protein [Emticicia sp. CRIBPO]|uniref:putative phage abortive infection protein n=1 Tax=Emticicia sp. CRIBPO TaxID=2683258 RepID=UPI001411E210|nr:putative phage abortive infection protein [Emticicia sp. CRIBPO]